MPAYSSFSKLFTQPLLILTLLLGITHMAHAQIPVSGRVLDAEGTALAGVKVWEAGQENGTYTDASGTFSLSLSDTAGIQLIASLAGYFSDTLLLSSAKNLTFRLAGDKTLEEVLISDKRPDAYISSLEGAKVEIITSGELRKAACCDLAGCFNTTASVQPMTTNVLTNSKELRILGLSGVYNQVLFDGMPLIQGLSYTYGISAISGPLVENIFVAKGANSVLQGFESVSGQINVIPKDPAQADRLLLNVYMNSFLESQGNLLFSTDLGKRKEWSSLTALHTAQPGRRTDGDSDGFMDLPLLTRYSVYQQFKYRNDGLWGWNSRIGLMYLHERRTGGQMDYHPETDLGSGSVYGQRVQLQQPSLYTKTGYRFNNDQAFSLIASGFLQQQDSWFGQTHYEARQLSLYANLQWEQHWGKNHDLKAGLSLRHFDLRETVSFVENPLNKTFAGAYKKYEWITGAFAENTFRWLDDRLTCILGLRADHHQQFGWFFTPRSLLKYDFSAFTTLRASAGYGWRTANIFSENINLLASQRDVIFEELLQPEEAINIGINVLHRFEIGNVSGTIAADAYGIHFLNQVFPDYDRDPTRAFLSNFTGTSRSQGVQADLTLNFFKRLNWKLSYNLQDVYRIENGEKVLLPFVSQHKFMTALSYQPLSESWQADLNFHVYGRQRLPDTEQLPEQFKRPGQSDPYALVNLQFTKTWTKTELYAGVENLFGFRQWQPIQGWQDPFGPYFDTASVWGPTRGREVYVGVRFRIPRT